ncbi:MAG TPA: YceI family protein [Nonomuraea sp.]|nr:YceI family protein [Nonomuraea sp.]
MSVPAGHHTLRGRLLVHTTRTGLGAKAGHDLTIEATRWHGDVTGSGVSVEVDAGSLHVREGTGGVRPLTAADRAEIEKNIREKVLRTGRHPTITFRAGRVEGTEESFRAAGDLTVVGVTRPVEVRGSAREGRVRGSAVVTQSRWGIRPYSAFFGALRLNDDVEVRFDVELVPADPG